MELLYLRPSSPCVSQCVCVCVCVHSMIQIVGKHHFLFDKEVHIGEAVFHLEPRPREWTHQLCEQSLGNVIINTVS